MITFNHSGGIGDILFSLYFCKDLSTAAKQEKFDFHIQTNVKDQVMKAQSHPFVDTRMTTEAANWLKPLLESQEYINSVDISDEYDPDNALKGWINLDNFRRLRINFTAGDIRNWYYNLTKQHLPREFWKPILTVEVDETYKDKIVFAHTARYQNVFIDYNKLKEFKDKMVFFGVDSEYEEFSRQYFNMEYYKCTDALDAAKKIAGAKCFCSGQCGLYSIAECLKSKRILVAPEIFKFNGALHPGPHNNHPQGGWCEDVSTDEKLVSSIEEALN